MHGQAKPLKKVDDPRVAEALDVLFGQAATLVERTVIQMSAVGIVALIVVAIVVWLLNWLYLRSSKERAFVRTGLGGQKVVMDGGAIVFPVFHETILVNMNTLKLEVTRFGKDSLFTKDRMRVDVVAEFYVRVAPTAEAVAIAAATLGRRTTEQERLHALLAGKFSQELELRRTGFERMAEGAARDGRIDAYENLTRRFID